jgi:hypothetical protein
MSGQIATSIPATLWMGFNGNAGCCSSTTIAWDDITVENSDQATTYFTENFSSSSGWYRARGCYACSNSGVSGGQMQMHSDWTVIHSSHRSMNTSGGMVITGKARWTSNVNNVRLSLRDYAATSSCNSCCPGPACNSSWMQMGFNPGNVSTSMGSLAGTMSSSQRSANTWHDLEFSIDVVAACSN